MNSALNSTASTILLIMRMDRVVLTEVASSAGFASSPSSRRFAGVGLPWYSLEIEGVKLCMNGVLALANGERAPELVDPAGKIWKEFGRRWPFILKTKRRPVAEFTSLSNAQMQTIEYYSGAVEMLDRMMAFVVSRPGATAREIAACERWLHGTFAQYFTGRGALRNVVLPWRAWLERYEYLLRGLEVELEELELPLEPELVELLSNLKMLSTKRDRRSIIREYRTRLGDLTDACNRVAAEIGVLGTFGSLALVPFESTLGILMLAPVVVAGVAYFGGHGLARAAIRRSRWQRTAIAPARPDRTGDDAVRSGRDLGGILHSIVRHPVNVIASPRLSVADVACAIEIRHLLLERTTCLDPLEAITLRPEDEFEGSMRIVIGGPLVRANLSPFMVPDCDLTDARGNGWEIVAGSQRVIHCDDDETVGCCVAGADGKTLFIFGVRDSGTVMVTRWLAHALDHPERAGHANWVALRRSKRSQPEELARG